MPSALQGMSQVMQAYNDSLRAPKQQNLQNTAHLLAMHADACGSLPGSKDRVGAYDISCQLMVHPCGHSLGVPRPGTLPLTRGPHPPYVAVPGGWLTSWHTPCTDPPPNPSRGVHTLWAHLCVSWRYQQDRAQDCTVPGPHPSQRGWLCPSRV